jgi:hypothetical protein
MTFCLVVTGNIEITRQDQSSFPENSGFGTDTGLESAGLQTTLYRIGRIDLVRPCTGDVRCKQWPRTTAGRYPICEKGQRSGPLIACLEAPQLFELPEMRRKRWAAFSETGPGTHNRDGSDLVSRNLSSPEVAWCGKSRAGGT